MPDDLKDLTEEQRIEAIERGVGRWMDKKFAELGKWTLKSALVALLGLLVKLLFATEWWQSK
jgi:hypothetical protein